MQEDIFTQILVVCHDGGDIEEYKKKILKNRPGISKIKDSPSSLSFFNDSVAQYFRYTFVVVLKQDKQKELEEKLYNYRFDHIEFVDKLQISGDQLSIIYGYLRK